MTDTYGTIWFGRDRYRIENALDQLSCERYGFTCLEYPPKTRLIISNYDAAEMSLAPSRFFTPGEVSYQSEIIPHQTVPIALKLPPMIHFETISAGERYAWSREGNPVQIDAEIDQMRANPHPDDVPFRSVPRP